MTFLENISGETLSAAQSALEAIFGSGKAVLGKNTYTKLKNDGHLRATEVPVDVAKSMLHIIDRYKQVPEYADFDIVHDELADAIKDAGPSSVAAISTKEPLQTTPPPAPPPTAVAIQPQKQEPQVQKQPQPTTMDPRKVAVVDDTARKNNGRFTIEIPVFDRDEGYKIYWKGFNLSKERLAKEGFKDQYSLKREIRKSKFKQKNYDFNNPIYYVHGSILKDFMRFLSRELGYKISTKSGNVLNKQEVEEAEKIAGSVTKGGQEVPTELRSIQPPKPHEKNLIVAAGKPDDNAMRLMIPVYSRAKSASEKKAYDEIRKAIMIIFAEKDPIHSFEKKKKADDYLIRGNKNQYHKFIILAKQFGFDVTQVEKVYEEKVAGGGLDKSEEIEGYFDDYSNFKSEIHPRFPNLSFQLYEEQKDGIAFLYSRKKAVLGDATGVGKTVQLSLAASMVLEKYGGGKVLIICPKSVFNQWHQELKEYLGGKVGNDISEDITNPKTWTLATYNTFSGRGGSAKTDPIIELIKNADFKVVIYDELHKLKSEKAKWSQNLAAATTNIPVKWGATATLASNKPSDVQNQIKMLGHSLGFLDKKEFAKEFAPEKLKGMKATGGQAFEDTIKAAENLNKWLHIAGVYIRREKEHMKDMPGITIGRQTANTDRDNYESILQSKLTTLKNPDHPLSRLGAERYAIAMSKVPATVNEAMNTILQGKKVLVFTCFNDAGKEIVQQLHDKLYKLDPSYAVISYTSFTKQSDKKKAKERFISRGPVDINGKQVLVKALVMSIKMGGTGISFPNTAEKMIVNDYEWTPEAAEQSEGRLYRINSEFPVEVKYMIANEDLDKILFQNLQRKRELAKKIQVYRVEYTKATTREEAEKAMSMIIDAFKEIKEMDSEAYKLVKFETDKIKKGKMEEWLTFKTFMNYMESVPEDDEDELLYEPEEFDTTPYWEL
jgi:SNF2 family DNA or RNA helicase